MPTFEEMLNQTKVNPKTSSGKTFAEIASQAGIQLQNQEPKTIEKPTENKPGFWSKEGPLTDIYEKRKSNIQETMQKTAAGQINPLQTGIRTVGDIAAGAGEALMSGLGAGLKAITPQKIEEKVSKAGLYLMQTKVGQEGLKALSKGIEKYQSWKTENPEEAKDLESVVNIATILPMGKGAQVAGKGLERAAPLVKEGLESTAGMLEKSAAKTVASGQEKLAQKLVMPVATKGVKEAQVARTSEVGFGPFKKSVIKPTTSEAKAMEAVKKVPEIKGGNTYQQNYNIIKKHNTGLSQKLEEAIAANDFIIPKQEITAKLKVAASNLAESPLITGDAEKMATKLLAGAKKIIDENPGTGSGLLKARKEFDSWVLNQKPKAFDATAENAFTLANREVRKTMNELLEAKATNVAVKESLAEQSALFRAMENIVPKAAQEADTAFGRMLQRTGQVLGTKNKVVQGIAAAVGIGGLGAAATFAPAAAALGGLGFMIYKGGKLLLRPEIREWTAKLLREIDKIIPEVTDPKKLLQLQKDKEAIKNFIEKPKIGLSIEDVSGGKPSRSLTPKTKERAFNTPAVGKTAISNDIAKAKASGQSFDKWVKGQGDENVNVLQKLRNAVKDSDSAIYKEVQLSDDIPARKMYLKPAGNVGDYFLSEKTRNAVKDALDTPIYVYKSGGINDVPETGYNAIFSKGAFYDDNYNLVDAILINEREIGKFKDASIIFHEAVHAQRVKLGRELDFAKPYEERVFEQSAKKAENFFKTRSQLKSEWDKVGRSLEPQATKGRTLTQADIIKTDPNINLKKDVPITDIHGVKRTIPEGEALTPYELKGNKVLLKDGEEYLVSKNQYDNIKGQAVKAEAKEFAPELKGLEESVMGKNYNVKVRKTPTGNWEVLVDNKKTSVIGKPIGEKSFTEEQALSIARKTLGSDYVTKGTNPTKYSQYQLPGGENYKEILIKAPVEKTGIQGTVKKLERGNQWEVMTGENKGALIYADTEAKALERAGFRKQSLGEQFKSSHWDEPNVISHLRMNERTYKGKKVAFMEELQSDWAREARAGKTEAKHELLKNWQEPTIKRALKEAVDTNADYFAWISGEQTSARYNLATQVDSVEWKPFNYKDGRLKDIRINAKEGRKTGLDISIDENGIIKKQSDAGDWVGKKLDEVLGKGLAEKIMAKETGTLSGEGLKFGGEWAENLYDRQVKNIVEDLTGAKVEKLDLGLPIEKYETKWKSYETDELVKIKDLKVGDTIYNNKEGGTNDWVITDILGDGKFKAVPKKSWESYLNKSKTSYFSEKLSKKEFLEKMKETFDISQKKAVQQGILLTPEIKARIRGEAPRLKQPSGVSPVRTLESAKSERSL